MARGYSTDRPLYTNAVEKLRQQMMPRRRVSLDSGMAVRGFRSVPGATEHARNRTSMRAYDDLRERGGRQGLTPQGEWDAMFGRHPAPSLPTPTPDPNAGQDNGTTPLPPPGSFQDDGWSTMLAPEAPGSAADMASVAPRPYSPTALYQQAAQRHARYLSDTTTTGRFGPQRTIRTPYGTVSTRSAAAVAAEEAEERKRRYQSSIDTTLAQLMM